MTSWLIGPTLLGSDPWPESMRERAALAVEQAGLGAEVVPTLLSAALADSVVRTATRLTVERTRVQHDGNTPLAADDPQFLEVLQETSGLALVAVSSIRVLLAGGLRDEEARTLQSGVLAVTRTVVDRVFETLGASATLEHHGLHRLWRASVDIWAETER